MLGRDLRCAQLPGLDAARESAPDSIVHLRKFDDVRGQPDGLDDAGSIETDETARFLLGDVASYLCVSAFRLGVRGSVSTSLVSRLGLGGRCDPTAPTSRFAEHNRGASLAIRKFRRIQPTVVLQHR